MAVKGEKYVPSLSRPPVNQFGGSESAAPRRAASTFAATAAAAPPVAALPMPGQSNQASAAPRQNILVGKMNLLKGPRSLANIRLDGYFPAATRRLAPTRAGSSGELPPVWLSHSMRAPTLRTRKAICANIFGNRHCSL